MNIENIALVRATNIIPFEGVIRPLSNEKYLCKILGGEFQNAISDLLTKLGILPEQDYSKVFTDEDYYDNYIRECANITKEYIPYLSNYNSIVLFSLNGICPDDSEHGFGNNTFSNKKCAIIEPLKYHIDDVISLVPTDTSVKGDVLLSDEAIILIEEQTFYNLSDEQKNKLSGLNVKIFNGSLKDAVKSTLRQSGKYTAEDLSLSQRDGGVKDSITSNELKNCIENIIKEYNLSRLKYFNLLLAKNDEEVPKYDLIKDEYFNSIKVYEFYLEKFLTELLDFINAPSNIKESLHRNLHNKKYMDKVSLLISNFGIEKYKDFVDNYNKDLELQKENGSLLTPEEIINGTFEINLRV